MENSGIAAAIWAWIFPVEGPKKKVRQEYTLKGIIPVFHNGDDVMKKNPEIKTS